MLKTVPIERISARQALEQEWLAPLLAPALPPMPTAPPDTTRGRRLSNPAAKSQSIGSQLSPVVVMGRQMASQTQGSNVLHSMDTGTHVASPRTERTSPITPLSIGMQRLSTSPRPPQQQGNLPRPRVRVRDSCRFKMRAGAARLIRKTPHRREGGAIRHQQAEKVIRRRLSGAGGSPCHALTQAVLDRHSRAARAVINLTTTY
jgi:hypothetical protein